MARIAAARRHTYIPDASPDSVAGHLQETSHNSPADLSRVLVATVSFFKISTHDDSALAVMWIRAYLPSMLKFRRSPRSTFARALAGLCAVLVVAALSLDVSGSASARTHTASGTVPAVNASTPCAGTGTPPAAWSHVTLIMFENKTLRKILSDTTDAPYINSIMKACSYSKNTASLSTTSLANYIALTSGYTGCDNADSVGNCTHELPITSNRDITVWPQAPSSLFELLDINSPAVPDAAVEWAESMPSNCYNPGSGNFVINHSPFQYYTRIHPTICPQYAVPFPQNPADALSAHFNLVIPNKIDIMHVVPNSTQDQRIRNGDNWLKGYLPQLLDSPTYQSGSSAIIITWDEGNAQNFIVPLIVITPYTTVGGVSSVAYNHYSTLRGIEEMLNQTNPLPLLGHAGDAGVNSIRDDAVFRLK